MSTRCIPLTYKRLIKRFPEIFIDDSTKVSIAKVGVFAMIVLIMVLVGFYCAFAYCEFSATKKIPALPQGLAWTITSLVGGISALYASNKFSPVVKFKETEEECKPKVAEK